MSPAPADRRFAKNLLAWYLKSARDLPWRRTSDPYAIWLSEIMLQQTQVATVIPYYHRFLDAFPSIQRLAAASQEAVFAQWEGLGYYARARHLHQAARAMVAQFSGQVPSTFDALLTLPGIGRSTAGAILTLAFGQRHPILDGNVRRVLCRYLAIRGNPKDVAVETRLWRVAARLLPQRRADEYTQAIMDLGATCCTPKLPACPACPVRRDCRGYAQGLQHTLPARQRRKPLPRHDHVARVILHMRAGKPSVFLRQRPAKGLLGGLWELPSARADATPGGLREAWLRIGQEHGFDLSECPPAGQPAGQIHQTFTHFKMTLHLFVEQRRARHDPAGLLSVPIEALANYPLPSAHRKIAIALGADQDADGTRWGRMSHPRQNRGMKKDPHAGR